MILMTLLKSNAYKIHCIVLWVKYWYRITKHLYKKFNNIAPMTLLLSETKLLTTSVWDQCCHFLICPHVSTRHPPNQCS